MKFSCYCHDDDDAMNIFVFAFAKQDDMIVTEVFYFSYLDGNLEEDRCKFFVTSDELKTLSQLNNFYNLSLVLTENPNKLVYHEENLSNEFCDHMWGISCRKHCVGKCFTDEYHNEYGFSEHPAVMFDKINKKKGIQYNKYSIRYYTSVYENTFNWENYMNIYINQEINKIAKELMLVEDDVDKDVMRCNTDILNEVLPEDIVNNIRSILVL